jgi:hypothetical protein
MQCNSNIFILNELKQLRRTKATGVDNLPPGMLKDCREHISQPLCHILNLSVKTARFPALWKVAKVVPIHKSGSYDRPDRSSPYEPAFSGVPQGSILGPLLFTVFYNDLADHLVNSRVKKYADDTVVYFSGKDVEAIEGALAQDLEEIARFSYQNELVINLKKGKTEIMLFGTGDFHYNHAVWK